MSRPIKQGLDYFPMDVDPDEKFELLEAKHGLLGFAVIIKLFQRIYREGYFLKWNEETALLFSKRIGVGKEIVEAIIDDAIRWQIFDKSRFKRYGVLTSSGIQKRFLGAISRRKSVNLVKSLMLTDISTIINVDINWVNVNNNTQSKVKKSREKESREKAPDFDADYVLKKFKEAFPDYQILNPDKESENAKQLLAFFKTLYPENVLDKVGEFIDKCSKIKNDFHQSKMSLQYMKDKYNELNFYGTKSKSGEKWEFTDADFPDVPLKAGTTPHLSGVDTNNYLNEME